MTGSEFAKGLRQLADWYDAHPEAPVPNETSLYACATDTKEEAVRIATMLGSCQKEWNNATLTLVKTFGAVRLGFVFWRSSVCTSRIVGTREVPERVVPARTENIVAWDCHPLLQPDAP